MSVATQHSPFAVGSKRLFESEENEDRLQRRDSGAAATHKRYRRHGSPADRCGSGPCQGTYSVSPATHAALRGLFPEMSDKVRRVCADRGRAAAGRRAAGNDMMQLKMGAVALIVVQP